MESSTIVILTARNEASCLGLTLRALRSAFPTASVWVADDGSSDGTSEIARAAGARVVRSERPIGKGGAATLAARAVLAHRQSDGGVRSDGGGQLNGDEVALLCDGDLGGSAELLRALVEEVRRGELDVAVASFARRVGGGLGMAVAFARWAIRRRCGLRMCAPISGQRALRMQVLKDVLPFADGFGMEIGMTIDAARAGYRVGEVELDLEHRASGRTLAGFVHRGRQLLDFMRVYEERR